MSFQYSTAVRNAALDAIETAAGTAAKLRVYTGAVPANTGAAVTGTLLLDITLASDWAANASAGTKALSGVPLSTTALAAGTAGYFRIVDSAGTTAHVQGTCGQGTGDLSFDNATFVSGQNVTINSLTFSIAGA